MLCWIAALAADAADAADPMAVRAVWESHRVALDRHARFPLVFDDRFWATLAGGGVARRRDHLEGTDRILVVELEQGDRFGLGQATARRTWRSSRHHGAP